MIRTASRIPPEGRLTRAEDGTMVRGRRLNARTLRPRSSERKSYREFKVAFSRTGDPDVGKFEDAVVLKKFGEVPTDLTMLF